MDMDLIVRATLCVAWVLTTILAFIVPKGTNSRFIVGSLIFAYLISLHITLQLIKGWLTYP